MAAGLNVVARTDELLYDTRMWCREVRSTNPRTLELISHKLGLDIKDDSEASRQSVTEGMARKLVSISQEEFFRQPDEDQYNEAAMDVQGISYSGKRTKAIHYILDRGGVGKDQVKDTAICPPIYARSRNGWQRTTFKETWKRPRTRTDGVGLPSWLPQEDNVVRFLRSESQVFGTGKHLTATNALYIIAIQMSALEEEFEEDEHAESRRDDGEEQRSCEDEDTEIPTDDESRFDEEEYESVQGDQDPVDADEEDVDEEDECEAELDENEAEKSDDGVHYYAGQTLRNVVKRCRDHCRAAKELLDQLTEATDWIGADKPQKLLLVESYLAAAKLRQIKHQSAKYNSAVFVVRKFVDRKAELIQRFRLFDMRHGLNGGRQIQTMITDFFGVTASASKGDEVAKLKDEEKPELSLEALSSDHLQN